MVRHPEPPHRRGPTAHRRGHPRGCDRHRHRQAEEVAIAAGLIVSAPRSGSGKTVVTLGLLRAFARSGPVVAAFKNGPDYIDPAFHAAATGGDSINLDSWAMPPPLLGSLAGGVAAGADLVIGEGSMGLFDGVAGEPGATGATADLAVTLGLPVLLVLDVGGQAQSAAAFAAGCAALQPRLSIAGVILNRVAGERHRRLAADALTAAGFRVLGALPRGEALALPERHLGLVQAGELPRLSAQLDAIADFVEAHVDLAAVRAAAVPVRLAAGEPGREGAVPPPGQRIALARDAAFSFLYPHLIAGWRAQGAELCPFSPLADEPPPEGCDCCWLPGGYPELHAGRLAAATRFLEGLCGFARTRPVHGECGGYMVLGRRLIDATGESHMMAGLLGVETSFAARKLHLGYRDATLAADGCLGPRGTSLRGHEFHYASVLDPGDDTPFAMVCDAHGGAPAPAGGRRGQVTGSFFHLVARR